MADDSIDNNNENNDVETSIAATSLVALEEENQPQPPSPPLRRRDLLSMLRHIEFVYYFLTPHELARCTDQEESEKRDGSGSRSDFEVIVSLVEFFIVDNSRTTTTA